MNMFLKNIVIGTLVVFIIKALCLQGGWQLSCMAQAADPAPVAVLLSNDDDSYRQAAQAFAEEYGRPVRQFSLHGRVAEMQRVMSEITDLNSPFILAFGAKATYAAKTWTAQKQEIPVIFAMVLNWRHFNFTGVQQNMLGIDTSPLPGSELAYLTMFAPEVKRIGIIHSHLSKDTVDGIEENAPLFGMEVSAMAIDSPSGFKTAFKKMAPHIDGYIVVRDPLTYSLDNLDWLTGRCLRSGIVCLGRSEEMARHGIMLTVAPSSRDLALQAVSIANSIFKGGFNVVDAGVVPPLSVRVVLNLQTARKLELDISEAALDTATEIIR